MESLGEKEWPFDVLPETAVLTSKYVTKEGAQILEVTHEADDEEGIIWQFHCGNGDYRESVLQLVRLDEILEIDQELYEIAKLPIGFSATREERGCTWRIGKI